MGLEHSVFSSGIIISCDSHASKCWWLHHTSSSQLQLDRAVYLPVLSYAFSYWIPIVTGEIHKITLLDNLICSTVSRQRYSLSTEQTVHVEGPESQRLSLSKAQSLKDRDSQRPSVSKIVTQRLSALHFVSDGAPAKSSRYVTPGKLRRSGLNMGQLCFCRLLGALPPDSFAWPWLHGHCDCVCAYYVCACFECEYVRSLQRQACDRFGSYPWH